VGAIVAVHGAEPPDLPDFAHQRERDEEIVFNYLLDVANSCRKPMRVYYTTVCPKEKSADFPSVRVQPPGKGKTGLEAVRDIFAKDKSVKVTEDGGVIRIWIGEPPTAILQAKLERLVLTPGAQYSPGIGFYELVNSKEMLRAEQALKYTPPLTYSNSAIPPNEKLPHLPGTIRDATAEQVLDKMAKTWAGEVIVIYGACAQKDDSGETAFWLEWQGQLEGDPQMRNPSTPRSTIKQ
jgi:hypothetical protein